MNIMHNYVVSYIFTAIDLKSCDAIYTEERLVT